MSLTSLKPLRALMNQTGLADLVAHRMEGRRAAAVPSPFTPLTGFGSNPGALAMWAFVPPGLPPKAPLVVVLHGCTQTAASYDLGAGWSTLAARHGFALLFPEQPRANNANSCFNWFEPHDIARRGGEAESIAQATSAMIRIHGLNAARTGVTGLSAGGAMTAVMLATYPEMFSAGAIIAGLPYGAAHSVNEAFAAMGGRINHTAPGWSARVRGAGGTGPWPAVQIWQGTADTTVRPSNADELVKQWTDLHGVSGNASVQATVDGAAHAVWLRQGRPVVERFLVPGLAHGTPIDTDATDADRGVGHAGPYMLDAGISSTWHIARSWGLLTQAAVTSRSTAQPPHPATAPPLPASLAGVLRKAGLLRG